MGSMMAPLGALEREVMQVVWANGGSTAQVVREQLMRRFKESTVRTVLHRLEQKGYVTHTVVRRTYIYRAAVARGRVAAEAIQSIAERFCDGSIDEVLASMVDAAMLDQRHLRLMIDTIAKGKATKFRTFESRTMR
jgi:BlaI family penicillinase repressor